MFDPSERFFSPLPLLLFLLLNGLSFPLQGQERYKIHGFVLNDSTQETLPSANIILPELDMAEAADRRGYFEMQVPEGEHLFRIEHIGYHPLELKVTVKEDERMNFRLTPSELQMGEVAVRSEREDRNIDDPQMSRLELEVEEIEGLPSLLGEVDVMRTIKLLPGVRSGGNGNSGLSVRGGAPDQNLVMLDDAVIHRPSHLFGFFSVFNGEAIDDVELLKGGIPARYGGRLSSVVDVEQKRGDRERFRAEGGIGLLSSRLTLQGPIVKDKTSFMIAGRRTYADIVSKPFIPENSSFSGSSYHFYDLNAGLSHRFSKKDRISLSAYAGRDRFKFGSSGIEMEIPWGNRMASLRWGHSFNRKLSLNTRVLVSDYRFRFGADQSQFGLSLFSAIRDYTLKSDLYYEPNEAHKLRFGLAYDFHRFTPSHADASSGGVEFDTGELEHIFAHELGIYLSDRIRVNDKLIVHPGIRFSSFHQVGPFKRYVQDELDRVTDTLSYAPGERVADYSGWEPRLSMLYKFREDLSVKASYMRNRQYLHMVSISPVSLPTDVWIPSSDLVGPQLGDQWAVGVFKNFLENTLESSIELYYREMEGLVEFEDGAIAENSIQNNIDGQLTFGEGTAYGAELFLKKRRGDFTGWLSYTWSKSFRSFPEIDDGTPFPATYDRRHDLSLTASWEFHEKWSAGATFVYSSGKAVTLPSSRYLIDGHLVTQFDARNSYRMRPYHRADLSLRFKPGDRKEERDPLSGELLRIPQRIRSTWSLSIYNVYNRDNPYFLYFTNEGSLARGTLNVKAQQVTLFPILPSISWEFEF